MARDLFRPQRLSATLLALTAAPIAAQAGPAAEAHMPAFPPEASAPLVPAEPAMPVLSILDPGLSLMTPDTDELIVEPGRSSDAVMADGLMRSLGQVARGGKTVFLAKGHDKGNRGKTRPLPAQDGFNWARFKEAETGNTNGLALKVSQDLEPGSPYSTMLGLEHASRAADVKLRLAGSQPLKGGAPMSLSYDGSALVSVLPDLSLGVTAKGDLGTVDRLLPAPSQIVEPVARLRLFGRGGSFSADTGYAFSVGQASTASLDRLRMKLNFDLKM